MRKVIMVMDTMLLGGGIEHAAVALLRALPPERYDVTLLLVEAKGQLLDLIPRWVKIEEIPLTAKGKYEHQYGRKELARKAIKSGEVKTIVSLITRRILNYISVPRHEWIFSDFNAALNHNTIRTEHYDCVLAFSDQLHLVWYSVNKIKAKKYIGWFHTEYPVEVVDRTRYVNLYNRFDAWFAVSSDLACKLNSLLQGMQKKICVFQNIIDQGSCRERAEQGTAFTDDFSGSRILSVGRLMTQKGFDIAVKVCSRLIKNHYNIRWYVIGEGPECSTIEAMIRKENLQDSFVLLGAYSNPYPFFKACDLYVQPSRFEGYCLTLAEARMFAKPIVCTDFAGAHDQLVDRFSGLIVNCDEEAIYSGVVELLNNSKLCEVLSKNLSSSTIDTRREVDRLCAIIDD